MTTRATILVVENETDIAGLLRDALRKEDHRVLTAGSVPAALAILRACRVQLVIADAPRTDPPADPWSALAPLLVARGDAPLLLCSADEPGECANHAAHSCVAFLHKPVNPAALLAVVASLLPGAHRAAAQGGGHALQQVS